MRTPSIQSQLIEFAPGYVHTPFVVLCDTAEKHPWTFDGIRSKSFVDRERRVYVTRVDRRYIGVGMGDYSLCDSQQDYRGRVAIERKSLKDFQGTLLGWGRKPEESPDGNGFVTTGAADRRARFKRELEKLAGMQCKAIVIEAHIGEILDNAPSYGQRTEEENGKYLFSTWLAWQQEFPGVPWLFCADRRMAEIAAFRILEKFWAREQKHQRTQRARNTVNEVKHELETALPGF